MTDLNIFENATPNSGEFFKFKNIGDSIQGTYIGKNEGVDSFGNEQCIYMIQDKEGKVWNVAFRKESQFVNERMDMISLGQIVGYRFDEERDSKKMPGKKAKIIRIYADNKFVDTEWLARQKELSSYSSNEEVDEIESTIKNAFEAPANSTVASGSLPKSEGNDALDAVRQLARTKGLTSNTLPIEEQDKLISTYTELPLTTENMTKIIISLTGYPK